MSGALVDDTSADRAADTPAGLPADADYVVLASRAALDLDGGFAVAVAGRLRQLQAAGAPGATLLTLDAADPAEHARRRSQYVDRGMLASTADVRNLFDEVLADSSWLASVAVPGRADGTLEYRVIADAAGRPVLSLPVIHDPAWHLSRARIVLHAADGDHVVPGFGALYIAWLEHVARGLRDAAGDPDRVVVVVCESRQTGELLADWADPRIRVVHTVHNSHLPAPYDDPSAELAAPWARWLARVHDFDAVLWPTRGQRDDVAARFGADEAFHVVPNPVDSNPVDSNRVDPSPVDLGPDSERAPGGEPSSGAAGNRARVVMVNRLADQKRVDVAIRAFAQVIRAAPGATLDVYGDGPLRRPLQALIDEQGLGQAVRLRGHTTDRGEIFGNAVLLLSTSAFEGQGLAILESLARGLPVVATDVRYGPGEAIGAGGMLVPAGDVDAVADAVVGLLRDPARLAAMASSARDAARAFLAEAIRPALVAALTAAVRAPSRRA